ncbi:conserved hypothetical protein [Ricinus communis]|uniref:Uncharacterized protein n=1 Tax=Ricinus communis TaxID=3988 RepID=B9SIV1_RICCO|nr:conserved hypothetical protein [Ricinus communis]
MAVVFALGQGLQLLSGGHPGFLIITTPTFFCCFSWNGNYFSFLTNASGSENMGCGHPSLSF